MSRARFARILAGRPVDLTGISGQDADDFIRAAALEGVLSLVALKLRDAPKVSSGLRSVLDASARSFAASALLRKAECRKVLTGIPPDLPVLVLKGSALAYWLYQAPFHRECADIDLLFSGREQAERAALALERIGYATTYLPHDLSYQLQCRRTMPGGMCMDLDMHWRLANAPLFADAFTFEELAADTVALNGLSADARGLSPVHAFVHACNHRALNLSTGEGDLLKWLYDLHLMAQSFTAAEWQRLLDMCTEKGLCGTCKSGIDASAEAFGPVVPRWVMTALETTSSHESLDAQRLGDWLYMQRLNFAAFPTWRLRLRWLLQRMFPPRAYLQALYGADVGMAGLWLQRLRYAFLRITS